MGDCGSCGGCKGGGCGPSGSSVEDTRIVMERLAEVGKPVFRQMYSRLLDGFDPLLDIVDSIAASSLESLSTVAHLIVKQKEEFSSQEQMLFLRDVDDIYGLLTSMRNRINSIPSWTKSISDIDIALSKADGAMRNIRKILCDE